MSPDRRMKPVGDWGFAPADQRRIAPHGKGLDVGNEVIGSTGVQQILGPPYPAVPCHMRPLPRHVRRIPARRAVPTVPVVQSLPWR
jgi:hypothetical protein